MSHERLECVIHIFRAIRKKILNFFLRVVRYCVGWFYPAVGNLVTAFFFIASNHWLVRKEYVYVASLCFPILAVLFGFTSLLYNRSRAFQPGASQRRSLYAAERGLQATLLFVFGMLIGVATITFAKVFDVDVVVYSYPSYEITIYFFAIVPVMLSFGAFFNAVRVVSRGTIKYLAPRKLMRRIRG